MPDASMLQGKGAVRVRDCLAVLHCRDSQYILGEGEYASGKKDVSKCYGRTRHGI